jgi:hypothetical protein
MDGIQVWQSIILPFASAGFGGWITAQFALGRFRKEKVWERKTAAYTVMFEALHDMMEWFDRHLTAEFESRQIPDEESKRLGQEYRKARETLLRRIASESWLLPRACIERVQEMNGTLDHRHESFFKDIDSGYGAVGSASYDLEKIVRRDLGLARPRVLEFVSDIRGRWKRWKKRQGK